MDDIGFLKQHGSSETQMILVDSAFRDRHVNPHPNEYTVHFDSVFKNVYSIEILSASVPRTQYSVDFHNNIFVYAVDGVKTRLEFQVGDYTNDEFIKMFNDLKGNVLSLRDLSVPGSLRSTFVFTCPTSFRIVASESTSRSVLGFDLFADPTETRGYRATKYAFRVDPNSGPVYKDVNVPDGKYTYEEFMVTANAAIYEKYRVRVPMESLNFNRRVEQDFVAVQNPDHFDSLEIGSLQGQYEHVLNPNHVWCQKFYYTEDYTFTGIDTRFEFDATDTVIRVSLYQGDTHVTSGVLDARGSFRGAHARLTANTVYSIHFSANREVASFARSVEDLSLAAYTSVLDFEDTRTWTVLREFGEPVALSVVVLAHRETFSVTAPGMYSLIGDTYITLRSKEIEDLMFSGRSNDRMGLAKFNLSQVGYSENVQDYIRYPKRVFHAKGKLDKVSFRFQRPDGSLYNFRGVNHTFVMLLHYYVPVDPGMNMVSSLNPDYNPDYLEYVKQQGDLVT